jgi:hypothetical protein
MGETGSCLEGQQLKQRFESALQVWRQSVMSSHEQMEKGTVAQEVVEWREEALAKTNAAADRMYLHRAHCGLCSRHR